LQKTWVKTREYWSTQPEVTDYIPISDDKEIKNDRMDN